MIGSSLVNIQILAKNKYNVGRFDNKITHITIHHMAAMWSAERLGNYWNETDRTTSSHYGIGKDGEIAQYVSESNTAWTNGSRASNSTAVTIETANSTLSPAWQVSDATLESLVKLVYDIAKRNNLLPLVKGQNLTWHSLVTPANQPTNCPGPYLLSKIDYIIERVNNMESKPFEIGAKVYNKEDLILYGTAGYDTLVQYVLPKNSENIIHKYHDVNGLYMALKNNKDELYPGAWTKEFGKFTLDKPIIETPVEEPPIVIPPIEEPTDEYVLLKEVFEAPETRVFRIKLKKGTKLYIEKK